MKFISPKVKLPEIGDIVLIKYEDGYYVTKFDSDWFDGSFIFIEACGEHYQSWDIEEVIGWMPVSELDDVVVA